MKTIGLIGGMSWESSIEYYRVINETTKEKLGGLHSAKCIMYSVDFAEIEVLQREGKWQEAAKILSLAARSVEAGGADFLVLCTNTMHKLVEDIQASIQIPILHIADATARKIGSSGIRRVGLLGTRFTMEEDFYKGRLTTKFNLEVIVPKAESRKAVDRIIYEELCLGLIKKESKNEYVRIIQELVESGAQGIILGCTEIGLLIKDQDCPVPLFDTARIHAVSAVEYAIGSCS